MVFTPTILAHRTVLILWFFIGWYTMIINSPLSIPHCLYVLYTLLIAFPYYFCMCPWLSVWVAPLLLSQSHSSSCHRCPSSADETPSIFAHGQTQSYSFQLSLYHMGPLHRLCASASPSDTKIVHCNFTSYLDCLHKIWIPLRGIILGSSWSIDFYGSPVQCRPQNVLSSALCSLHWWHYVKSSSVSKISCFTKDMTIMSPNWEVNPQVPMLHRKLLWYQMFYQSVCNLVQQFCSMLAVVRGLLHCSSCHACPKVLFVTGWHPIRPQKAV